MKIFKKLISIFLLLIILIQMLAGCVAKTDSDIFLTKAEFLEYFIIENSMSSKKYTRKDLEECEDGSVPAEIMVEWGYLTEKQAKSKLNKPVTKEIVVLVCAQSTLELKKGKTSDIKDAELLDNPQIIADAYESGFFELENGYFNGAKKMSLEDCEVILENAKNYTANFHYSPNSEKIEYSDDVIVQDDSECDSGDVIIDFFEQQENEQPSNSDISYKENDIKSQAKLVTLANVRENKENTIFLNNQYELKDLQHGFKAIIDKYEFEINLKNPNIGDIVVFNKYTPGVNGIQYNGRKAIGRLEKKKDNGIKYECEFSCPNFEEIVDKCNVEEDNESGVEEDKLTIFETNVDGWKLDFDTTKNGVEIVATKDFVYKEVGRKQDWQNSKKTTKAKAKFKISDFQVDIKNLRSFAKQNEKGAIKVTCDTDSSLELSQDLRFTPDSNRNGKFPSNWGTSRFTDKDSKGADKIKIAKIPLSLYGVVSVDINIYLKISVDGKISIETIISDGGIEILMNNGLLSIKKLGTKLSNVEANVNLYTMAAVCADLKLFSCVDLIAYELGFNTDIHTLVSLYFKDKLEKKGIYADQTGLDEYQKENNEFYYCMDVLIDMYITGKLEKSGIKSLLRYVNAEDSLSFKYPDPGWEKSLHFEDGQFVDQCTRQDKLSDELKKSEDDSVELESYKIILINGEDQMISLSAVPGKTKKMMNSKNAITVKSKDKKICKAKYIKSQKAVLIESTGEGNTEIIIKAKKGHAWWKKTVEQRIAVTVIDDVSMEFNALDTKIA